MTHINKNILNDYTNSIFTEDNYFTTSEYSTTLFSETFLNKYNSDSSSIDNQTNKQNNIVSSESEGVVSDFFDLIIKIFSGKNIFQ
jgi:hypothetical protein